MLPVLLRYAGDGLADDPAPGRAGRCPGSAAWCWTAPARPVPAGVRDGELLYLRPRGAEPPELAFDDVVDAVATATQRTGGPLAPAARPGRSA